MKRIIVALMMMAVALAVTGCGGGGDHSPDIFVSEIFSDETIDGDIRRDPGGLLTVTRVTPATASVFAGVDPTTLQEYRAFLHFPLDEPPDDVPLNARIDSAVLDIVINSVTVLPPATGVPILIDLVDFTPPLEASLFDRTGPATLATMIVTPAISSTGRVVIDVTPLMTIAQEEGLPSFQIRILQGSGSPGLIEIDDSADLDTAPFLTVTYF